MIFKKKNVFPSSFLIPFFKETYYALPSGKQLKIQYGGKDSSGKFRFGDNLRSMARLKFPERREKNSLRLIAFERNPIPKQTRLRGSNIGTDNYYQENDIRLMRRKKINDKMSIDLI